MADQQAINRAGVAKFYSVAVSSREYFNSFFKFKGGHKDILELGCGTGRNAIDLAGKSGVNVIGIDVSSTAIEAAASQAKINRIDNVKFMVMNAECADFADNSFDIVYGMGVLHHLDIHKALGEIVRITRPDGSAIFIEPMGYNPLINLFRRLTPRLRVKEEHPFKRSDLSLFNDFFQEVNLKFFHLFVLLAVPFRNTVMFNVLLKYLNCLDNIILRLLPGLKLLFWQVVIVMKGPKKQNALKKAAR